MLVSNENSMKNRSASLQSEINVTPLVDVVLVLLIIFMVVSPVTQRLYEVNASSSKPAPVGASKLQIVVTQISEDKIYLNRESVNFNLLSSRLQQLLKGQTNTTIFFSGSNELSYGMALRTLDLIRNAGAENIGIITGEQP
jgi:biopolymer transport protein TolR